MEVNELRIGNLYYGCSRGEVETVYAETILAKQDTNLCMNPIPLTEEWLIKLGFKNKELHEGFYIKDWRFHISSPMNYGGFLLCEEYKVITDRIKYIHQLQNLYFALTGEELTLK